MDKYRVAPHPKLAKLWSACKLVRRLPGVVASRHATVTWLQRELMPGRLTLEPYLGRPILFDVDDAIWLNGHGGFAERIASLSAGVIAGNSYIAKHFAPFTNHVWVVPTVVDTEIWRPPPPTLKRPPQWTLGWTGSSSSLPHLEGIADPLASFLGAHPEVQLLVLCDRQPALRPIAPRQIRYLPWSLATEVAALWQMDVGLMPLPDTDWARGKCAFKMIQYMAVGIPVIASPVGPSVDILAQAPVGLAAASPEDWPAAMERLYRDPSLCRSLGATGRFLAEGDYSVAVNAQRLARIFRDVT